LSCIAKRKKTDKQEVLKATNQFNDSAIKLAEEYQIKSFGFDIPEQLFQESALKYRKRYNLLNQFKETVSDMLSKGLSLDQLQGSNILFGKRSGIDSKGRLVLCVNELVSDWIPHVRDFSQDRSILSIKYAKSRVLLEKKVAELLQVSQFYSNPELENSYTYEALLNNIIKEFQSLKKTEWPASIKVKISSLPLQAECSTGTLVIPISGLTPHIVYTCLTNNGKEIFDQFQIYRESAENIRQFYHLISLTYQTPPELTDDQLWDCFSRLSEGASSLVPYLSGIRLHVANDYGMNDEGKLLSIKWDYLI